MKTRIFITTQFEAVHAWTDCQVTGVEFLQYPHRHIFHVRMEMKVSHDNRAIEFIDLKRVVDETIRLMIQGNRHVYEDSQCEFVRLSCEQMATIILKQFKADRVEVSEDGENGAVVEV